MARISDNGPGWSTIPQKQVILIINEEIDTERDKLAAVLLVGFTALSEFHENTVHTIDEISNTTSELAQYDINLFSNEKSEASVLNFFSNNDDQKNSKTKYSTMLVDSISLKYKETNNDIADKFGSEQQHGIFAYHVNSN